MPIDIKEAAMGSAGERGGQIASTRRFVCTGSDDGNACAQAVADHIQSIDSVDDVELTAYSITAEQVSLKHCIVTVDRPFRLFDAASFNTTGGTVHLSQSLRTMGRYPAPGQTAPNYEGAIGVTQSSVDGVDVPAPALNWTKRKKFKFLSNSYIFQMVALTGSINASSWRGFSPGEALFLGAEGGEDDQNFVELVYHFAIKPTQYNFSIGSITIPKKRGWDYIWVRHKEKIVGDRVLTVPAAAYVEQVHPEGNFSVLAL